MKTKNKTGEAPKPLGAAPAWKVVVDGKELRKRLTDLANKMEPKDAKKRKLFIAQGMKAIEQQEVRQQVKANVEKLMDELRQVMNRHKVVSCHIVIKQELESKSEDHGISGWATTSKVEPGSNGLELLGVLAKSLMSQQDVSSSTF